MQHAILFGEHDLVIDEKHRLLIPSDIRKTLKPDRDGEAFFIVVGHNGKAWLYPELYYNSLVSQIEQSIVPDESLHDFDQWNFARASRVDWDAQGRILIPDKMYRRARLEREVTLIGVRDHLEIWNRQEWSAREAELNQRMPEIFNKARQAALGRMSPNGALKPQQ